MDVVIGPEIIKSYKRLSYTPWHAFAEFVDNSTQSFLDNTAELTSVATGDGPPLHVEITYSPAGSGSIVITDNAMGMSREELASSLHIGRPPERSGRALRIRNGIENCGLLVWRPMDSTDKKARRRVWRRNTIQRRRCGRRETCFAL